MKRYIFILMVFAGILGFSQTRLDSMVFDEINAYRASMADSVEGLKWYVEWNDTAYQVADNQVEYMASSGDVSHDQSVKLDSFQIEEDFNTRFERFGINSYDFGENVVAIFDYDESEEDLAKRIFTCWKKSPSHNAFLLNPLIIQAAVSHRIVDKWVEMIVDDDGQVQEVSFGPIIYVAFDAYN